MSSSVKSDCRKFSPNVFNKSKCQNCFRTKDVHSAEALENNRASRNVFKCGYLFVAPDWDFNVSVNRTKRWQRRWFVLYDDGELTYSLDEFPETIPQGTIDMNKVLEVSDAEGVTGNEFAISITTPDKIHFVKGTSKEESKWWFDVLSRVAPRHLSRGKHKRNATFPCGRTTIPTAAVIAQDYCSEDDIRLSSGYGRPKFLSSSGDLLRSCEREQLISALGAGEEEDEDVFPASSHEEDDVQARNALNTIMSQVGPQVTEDQSRQESVKSLNDSLSQLEELESRRRNRRYLKRENRLHRNQRSRSDGVSKMIPAKNRPSESPAAAEVANSSALAAAEKLEYLESIHGAKDSGQRTAEEGKAKDSPASSRPGKRLSGTKTNLRKSESLKHIPSEVRDVDGDHVAGLRRYHSFKTTPSHMKAKPNVSASGLRKFRQSVLPPSKSVTPTSGTPVSTPTENESPADVVSFAVCSEQTVDGVFTRTGWLLRETHTKDWSRHWFVLRDSSLTYYRDPSAERCGIMDGILDLNQVSSIRGVESDRHYAFCLLMWDGKKHLLASETDEFRRMWVQSLQYASNLWSSASKEDFICTEIVLPEHSFHADRTMSSPNSSSLSCACHAETSSSSSDDQSEYFSLVDEDEVSDLSSSPRTLPPSPPVNRTMMSLVKEKSRIRSGGCKTPNQLHSTPLSDIYFADERGGEAQQLLFNRSLSQDALHSIHHEDVNINELFQSLRNGEPPTFFGDSEKNIESKKYASKVKIASKSPFDDTSHCETSKSSTPDTDSPECSTCSTVKSKLVAAKDQIRKLKKELAEAHANFDKLEMYSFKQSQDLKLKEEDYTSQISLMTAKIDDLTSKFTLAEKNYRQLKQKTSKSEGKERKRSSLKNKENLTLTKEYELKLCDLEKRINHIESSVKNDPAPSSNVPECSANPVELSEEASSATPSSEKSQGLFSRLQSLASRTQKVDEQLTVDSVFKKPGIRLEVRGPEEQSLFEEACNDQWATSFDKNIKKLNEYLEDYPRNMQDFKNAFFLKTSNILQWLQNSLDNICQEQNSDTPESRSKCLLYQRVFGALKLSSDVFFEAESESMYLTFLKMTEVVRFLEKISRVESFNCMVQYDLAECSLQVVTKTLYLAFAEYNSKDISNLCEILAKIPHVHFFCPVFNKLHPGSGEEPNQSTSSRLLLLRDQRSSILNSLLEAKKARYECLWNALADVPVQDTNNSKPQKTSSIEQHVTFLATDVFRLAELQLPLPQPNFFLQQEVDIVKSWGVKISHALSLALETFLSELKDQCPMVHESTVSLLELSDATRREITHLAAELSFLCITHAILDSLFDECSVDFELDDSVPPTSLFSRSSPMENHDLHSNHLKCRKCSTICHLLSVAHWDEYVQRYKFFNPRSDQASSNFERLGDGSASHSNCDTCDPSSALGTLKDACNNVACSECDLWVKKLCATKKQHELEMQLIDSKYAQELQLLEETLIKSSEVHDEEMLLKEKELESTSLQLQHLKTEYEDQIQSLKSLYEQQLQFKPDDVDQDAIRQTYKIEIEDLKDMFRKGFAAIENSHQRITKEMEKKHEEEVSFLKAEKQRALELEAKATVTAIEAIKKSHEQQLIKETANIKEDLLKKFQNGEYHETYFCKYGSDLEHLKEEILNITEMYSSKCLENVSLEEKVSSLKVQLEGAHNELCTLLSKNKEIDFCLSDV